ncbi:unnamed protein product, partial [Schistosoma curassoni]|uniref:COPI_C domain-containing protein n=1 Tax=Schistosoma curassoni TaxID=6186 RepID=A0A183L061_9TREM
MIAVIVLEVSAPYSRTVLTFVLKILTLVLAGSCFEFRMFFNCRNADLVLPIRAFISASDPSCLSIMFTRYVKVSISSRAPSKTNELEDELDIGGDAVNSNETGDKNPEDGGWDINDADLELPSDLQNSNAVLTNKNENVYVAPSPGRPNSYLWSENSNLPADQIMAGNWMNAMRLLNAQVGVVNFEPYKTIFMNLFSASRIMCTALPLVPSQFAYPQRNWKKISSTSALPAPVISLNELITRLQTAYQLTTKGKFQDAINRFRIILLSIPLLVVDSPSEESEARSLINICREYIVGLSMEMTRKSMPKDTITEQIRNAELACYFTHCRLETPHLILTLRTALNLLYKLKNYRSAATMARRLLDLAPSLEVAQQTRKILQACESVTPNEDSHALSYDPLNPFDICAATYTPIYRGKDSVRDPLSGAYYVPTMKGQ